MANNAFDAMNQSAGNDMYITGGAISMSEYEQNMNPQDQQRFEGILMDEFMALYKDDPYKGDLDFKYWLRSLNPELLRERAHKYEEVQAKNNGLQHLMNMENGRLLEDAGVLQKLAHLHTGRIEDLIDIVSVMEPEATPFQPSEFRRPEGSVPPPAQVEESPMEGGGDQGPY